jgi:hypothetical protein
MDELTLDQVTIDQVKVSEPAKSGDDTAAPVFSVAPQLPKIEPVVPDVPVVAIAPPVTDQLLAVQPVQAAAQPVPEEYPVVMPETEQPSPVDASLTEANKLRIIGKALKNVEKEIATIIHLLESNAPATAAEAEAAETAAVGTARNDELSAALRSVEGRVTEGVFDGQNMVGSDGKIYTVPANYASKSKLVEGDMLKLTITPKGSFIYKQIGPIERSRIIGNLGFDPTIGEYYATTENRRWSIIKASVTYYKGDPGDEVVLLVPKNAPSKWAAVENIIKHNPLA